ncbi:MAG: hypothetical protein HY906_03955 [Deltaproteobacteria bacterium]|nr:hypothetical protein [Deltaproteobacteria bacterium]
MKRIKLTSKTAAKVHSSSRTLQRVAPEQVASALGAEVPPTPRITDANPLTLLALRQEISRRLASRGGRPALEDAGRRQKIPLADLDWQRLQRIARSLADEEARPTPGQVASTLLRLALQTMEAAQADVRRDLEKTRAALQAAARPSDEQVSAFLKKTWFADIENEPAAEPESACY